jgi:hypothetical protein
MGQGPHVHISENMFGRPDTRFKLELGDQICALLIEVGVYPVLMRDIRKILYSWRFGGRCHMI